MRDNTTTSVSRLCRVTNFPSYQMKSVRFASILATNIFRVVYIIKRVNYREIFSPSFEEISVVALIWLTSRNIVGTTVYRQTEKLTKGDREKWLWLTNERANILFRNFLTRQVKRKRLNFSFDFFFRFFLSTSFPTSHSFPSKISLPRPYDTQFPYFPRNFAEITDRWDERNFDIINNALHTPGGGTSWKVKKSRVLRVSPDFNSILSVTDSPERYSSFSLFQLNPSFVLQLLLASFIIVIAVRMKCAARWIILRRCRLGKSVPEKRLIRTKLPLQRKGGILFKTSNRPRLSHLRPPPLASSISQKATPFGSYVDMIITFLRSWEQRSAESRRSA